MSVLEVNPLLVNGLRDGSILTTSILSSGFLRFYSYSGVVFYDLFDDADSTSLDAHTPNIDIVGGGWDERKGDLLITNNELGYTGADSVQEAVFDSGTSNGDISIRGRITEGKGLFGIIFRWQDDDNFWLIQISGTIPNTNFTLFDKVSGTFTSRQSEEISSVQDQTYTIRVVFRGSDISCYFDGELKFNHSSSLYQTESHCGIRGNLAAAPAEDSLFDYIVVSN